MPARCASENTLAVEEEEFWNGHWDAHKVGWLISGSAAAVTLFISLITIFGHASNYNRPSQQRQIIRILFFAPVFAIISFFSYRFFRSYTYYELVEVIYEAIAIASFLILMLTYIGDDSTTQMKLFASKDKRKLPMPFCCFRYRPSKVYFLVLTKWSVVQYCFVRPMLSIAGIVLQYYGLLCNSSISFHYGHIYLLIIDFISISIALYGLIVLYGLLKQDLQGKKPLAKFLTIKLGIFFIFYQGFVFTILEHYEVIKATRYWTQTNVSNGLNSLATTLEMILIALFQLWAFPWQEYAQKEEVVVKTKKGSTTAKVKMRTLYTNPIPPIFHAIWMADLIVEGWHSLKFAFDRLRGKEYTRQDARFNAVDFVAAFGAGEQGRYQTQEAPRQEFIGLQTHNEEDKHTLVNVHTNHHEPSQHPHFFAPDYQSLSREQLYQTDFESPKQEVPMTLAPHAPNIQQHYNYFSTEASRSRPTLDPAASQPHLYGMHHSQFHTPPNVIANGAPGPGSGDPNAVGPTSSSSHLPLHAGGLYTHTPAMTSSTSQTNLHPFASRSQTNLAPVPPAATMTTNNHNIPYSYHPSPAFYSPSPTVSARPSFSDTTHQQTSRRPPNEPLPPRPSDNFESRSATIRRHPTVDGYRYARGGSESQEQYSGPSGLDPPARPSDSHIEGSTAQYPPSGEPYSSVDIDMDQETSSVGHHGRPLSWEPQAM
ncbi:unnamed protein product [Sympodiomycopsis kandeliae]